MTDQTALAPIRRREQAPLNSDPTAFKITDWDRGHCHRLGSSTRTDRRATWPPLGFGESSAESIVAAFRDTCGIGQNDGATFDAAALRVTVIRDELKYGRLRLMTTATIASARLRVVVDIGFGDAIEPGLEEIDLPVLLDFPPPHLRAYARETVIAEKFQAMVALGRANSRMKDYHDIWLKDCHNIWLMSRSFEFDETRLARAIAAPSAGEIQHCLRRLRMA